MCITDWRWNTDMLYTLHKQTKVRKKMVKRGRNQMIYKDRRVEHDRKWSGIKAKFGSDDLLPLWIADMDFEAPKCVKNALKEYVDFGVFGYYDPTPQYFDSIIQWEKQYHDYKIEREWIRYAPGAVPAFNWLIHNLTKEEESVIILTPVYYPFREGIVNNNRKLVQSHLVRTEDSYQINFEDFEQKIVEHDVKLFIFCNPHNPVGRAWNAEEIKQLMDICVKHHVYVISDEIHQDLVMKGYKKVTAATVGYYDEWLITITAATKTFNLASVQNAILIIPDEKLRKMYDAYLVKLRITTGNAFGYIAVQSAYQYGRRWLEEVLEVIESNYFLMKDLLEKELPDVWIPRMEATYLMWIDLGKYIQPQEMENVILSECGLAVDFGSWFGEEDAGFIRINLATRRENIEQAAENIIRVLKKRKQERV